MTNGEQLQAAYAAAKDPNVPKVYNALLYQRRVRVKTATREFEGGLWELYRSPFGSHIGARVVDDEGRVHHFKVSGHDAEVELLEEESG